MRYQFPVDMTLEEVREAVTRQNERLGTTVFIEADRGDHIIFNYVISFDGSFPTPNTGDVALDREYAILRECRGLTFAKESGRVIARKYHKFFNVNEKPETQHGLIDWSYPHDILEKLDGSMITAHWVGAREDVDWSQIRWATKMGLTDVAAPVDAWVSNEANQHYARWAAMAINADLTPIFEWCSRQQKIVIDYPEDRLVLTAIRNNRTGEYSPRSHLEAAQRSLLHVVETHEGLVGDVEAFLSEGRVIRFTDGHMLKVKGAWYCQLHKTKEQLQFEKDVLSLILSETLDDAKAFMDAGDRESVEAYHRAFEISIHATGERLNNLVLSIQAEIGPDKKLFAQRLKEMGSALAELESSIMFKIWDGHMPTEVIRGFIARYTSSQTRVNTVRHLMNGLNWQDFRGLAVNLDD